MDPILGMQKYLIRQVIIFQVEQELFQFQIRLVVV